MAEFELLKIKDYCHLPHKHYIYSFNLAVNSMIYLMCEDGESWGEADLSTSGRITAKNADICEYLSPSVTAEFLEACNNCRDYYLRVLQAVKAVIKANVARIQASGYELTLKTLSEKLQQHILINSVNVVFMDLLPLDAAGFILANEKELNEALYSAVLDGLQLTGGNNGLKSGLLNTAARAIKDEAMPVMLAPNSSRVQERGIITAEIIF